jgi:hypothetical protein
MLVLNLSFALGPILWTFLNSSRASAIALRARDNGNISQAGSNPIVTLGQTSIIGKANPDFRQEFFGGACRYSAWLH